MNYGVASLSRYSKSKCVFKTYITELEGPQPLMPAFEGEHLEYARTTRLAPISPMDKFLGSHMVIEVSSFSIHPHYDKVDQRW